MRRRAFIAAIGGMIAVGPFSAATQTIARPPRIGVIRHYSAPSSSTVDREMDGFRGGLAGQGYVEGRNIIVDYRWTEGSASKLRAIADELVSLKPVLVVTHGELPIRALRKANDTLPIVVAVTGDLVVTGHAASLARPGGYVTGLVDSSPELSGKRLQLATELVPDVSRIAILWNGDNRVKEIDFQETVAAARTLGLAVESFPVKGPRDFEPAFVLAREHRASVMIILQDSLTIQNAEGLSQLAAHANLPMISAVREFAEAGGLATYGANVTDMWRRAAGYVDRILRGATPSELPIEQPTVFELVINLKAAKALGLTIPPALLARADAVIE